MKRINTWILFLATTFYLSPLSGQVVGSGEIVKQRIQPGTFSKISVSGAQEAVLMNDEEYSVTIETQANLLDHIDVVIENGVLAFRTKKIKRYDVMKFYITAPDITSIFASGATEVSSPEVLGGNDLGIVASGASEVDLKLNYKTITLKASGASEVRLQGSAQKFVVETSGASEVVAKALKADTAVVNASGASECFVNADTKLTYQLSGASEVSYVKAPQTIVIESSQPNKSTVILSDSLYKAEIYTYSDTTTVKVGSLDVEVIEGYDTTKVSVGRHAIVITDDGNVRYVHDKKKRFNGHWGGVEMGINGYVTPQFNTNWGKEYDYLNLRYEKSWTVNLNLYEQNIALNKDKNMGFVTGIGMSWANYRFSPPTYLTPDSSEIKGYYMINEQGNGLSVRKSKLTVMYITVPFMYEIQTKKEGFKSFHFGIGVLGSARVRTHTKIYFNNANEVYYLQNPDGSFDTEFGRYITPNASDRNIVKNYNSFHLQPFKFEGMIRVGFSFVNLWAHVGLNQFFMKDRGPELYTWTAGITLVGW
ncbi:MAG: hypothetical protein DRI72_07760 [Bacteroidetes bacterium]|nr:MAG: hypothetical protein DRI72_07760 [Bacteroidota bacterium]